MMLGQLAKNDLINQSNFLVFRKNSKYTVKNEEYTVRNNQQISMILYLFDKSCYSNTMSFRLSFAFEDKLLVSFKMQENLIMIIAHCASQRRAGRLD